VLINNGDNMKDEYETFEDFVKDLFPNRLIENEERLAESRKREFLDLFFL